MNQQLVEKVKVLVDDIIHNVSIGRLVSAKVLLETLRILLSVPK